MRWREQFLSEVEAFLLRTGVTASRLGVDAVNDPSLVTRLRNGGDVTLQTADRIREHMANWRPPAPRCRARQHRAGIAAA